MTAINKVAKIDVTGKIGTLSASNGKIRIPANKTTRPVNDKARGICHGLF